MQKVYPADVITHMAALQPGAHHGRPRIHPVPSAPSPPPRALRPEPSAPSAPAEQVLAAVRWRRLSWRAGTKGPRSARFAAARVVATDETQNAGGQHLLGEGVWVVGERRDSGETTYYLANLPEGATLWQLGATIKARWACEQAHQHLKEELGLDHVEGRTWTGLHHHALLTRLSFAFLQPLRLTGRRPSSGAAPSPAGCPAGAAGRPRRPCPGRRAARAGLPPVWQPSPRRGLATGGGRRPANARAGRGGAVARGLRVDRRRLVCRSA